MLVQNLPTSRCGRFDCESHLHIIKIRVNKVYCEAPSRRLNKELVMTMTYYLATQKKEALTTYIESFQDFMLPTLPIHLRILNIN